MAKNEPTIHQQNISVFMKEIYKFENDLSPSLIDDIFQVCQIAKIKKNQVKKGLQTIFFRAPPQLWNLVPTEIKDRPSLLLLKKKKKIKSWYCDNCPCRSCKSYIASVGFL